MFVSQIVEGEQSVQILRDEIMLAVRPDAEIFSQRYPKSSHGSFYLKIDVFKIANQTLYLRVTFVRKVVVKNIQKSPNLVIPQLLV